MPMAGLPFAPYSPAKHNPTYSVGPSTSVEVDVSSMREDVLVEDDGTPLSPSYGK